MKKIMISQIMNGKSDDDILKERSAAIAEVTKLGYEVVDTFFREEWANNDEMIEAGVKNIPVAFLSKSISKMSLCDAVYFCKGWETARGCKIEHSIAEEYGLDIIEA